jgi:uncharacterized membrane protein YgcG
MLRALPILLLTGLGGCIYDPHAPLAPDFGESVTADMATQVVNPVPLRPSGVPINNGIRMDAAYQRYQTNRMYRPGPAPALQAATSNVSGGGGGGGGGGDSGSGGGSGGGSPGGGSAGGTSPY